MKNMQPSRHARPGEEECRDFKHTTVFSCTKDSSLTHQISYENDLEWDAVVQSSIRSALIMIIHHTLSAMPVY